MALPPRSQLCGLRSARFARFSCRFAWLGFGLASGFASVSGSHSLAPRSLRSLALASVGGRLPLCPPLHFVTRLGALALLTRTSLRTSLAPHPTRACHSGYRLHRRWVALPPKPPARLPPLNRYARFARCGSSCSHSHARFARIIYYIYLPLCIAKISFLWLFCAVVQYILYICVVNLLNRFKMSQTENKPRQKKWLRFLIKVAQFAAAFFLGSEHEQIQDFINLL